MCYTYIGDYMIKGMPTLIEFNLYENIDFAKKNNIDFIELNMNLPYCFNLKENELLKYNYNFTMHISEELNIYELNDHLRESYLNEIERQINIGISNNISKYTIHLNQGIYFTINSDKTYLNEIFISNFKKSLNKSLTRINNIATKKNIVINFENTKFNDFVMIAIEEIIKYDNLGFTLDIGHNEKDKNKFFNYLLTNAYLNKIRHVHMHDYNGNSDHLPISSGIIDFKKYCNILKKNYVVLEIKESKELLECIKNLD